MMITTENFPRGLPVSARDSDRARALEVVASHV